MISTRTIVLLSALWLASVAMYAQNGEPQNTEQRGALSGMWIVQDPGSGSWAEWYDNVPKAQLRPDIGIHALVVGADLGTHHFLECG